MNLHENSSILIVKLSAIGDVIHSLPALEALRTALPKARIGWVVEELSAPILQDHPHIDKLYVIPKKAWRSGTPLGLYRAARPFFRAIRDDKWDVTVDLQGLTKSALAAYFSGAKIRIGPAGQAARELSLVFNTKRVYTQKNDDHVVKESYRILSGLGLRLPKEPPRGLLPISDDLQSKVDADLRSSGWDGQPFITLNIGAGWVTKRYPEKHFGQLGTLLSERLAAPICILWGPKEEARRDAIAQELGRTPHFIAPPTSVIGIAAVARRSRLFVAGDTGAAHMAAMIGTPTAAIFGASDGVRNSPWPRQDTIVLQRNDLGCIKCWETKCPIQGKGHLACLYGLNPKDIAERIIQWLDSRS